ncbi:MAG: helix-turn-helix domain-containing protein [Lachnospiraceae bacterium]|nr:helix-turn-helix domain-containing protein [Lachnospiraceae bacterium]MBQ9644321.1 helix-turn-helix domain-containing protein [Lachnospiraceae bacterium]
MISNQALQNTIDGIKGITHLEIGILDSQGREIAVTAPVFAGLEATVMGFAESEADSQQSGQYQFFKVFDEDQLEYVVCVCGESDNALMIGRMTAFQIDGLMSAFRERFDRDNFIKNLLLDNLLLVDIFGRAKKLHVPATAPRSVMLIESRADREKNVLELMQSYPGNSTSDFVTAVDENNVVIVKDVSDGIREQDLMRISSLIMEYLERAGVTEIRIAYGTVVQEIREVSRSYKEAKMALDVSRIFMENAAIIPYTELGIGRLIYQLPVPLCKLFIRETFKGKDPEELDEETLATIDRFFENNLNVSETSRQLFIHRNTLVYRLDKLQKSTGLDLRIFEDAITFKIALMVEKYMKYMEKMNY